MPPVRCRARPVPLSPMRDAMLPLLPDPAPGGATRTEEGESMMQRLLLVVMLAGLVFLFLAAVAILLT
mgnify:CR=1 FL=1